jgi:signal peptidase I
LKRRLILVWALIVLLVAAGCQPGSGDRVLVAKYMYDSHAKEPRRLDVVVFRFPLEPIKGGTPTNYIKRLLGLAGETIAIFFGQLFYTTDLSYQDDLSPLRYVNASQEEWDNLMDKHNFPDLKGRDEPDKRWKGLMLKYMHVNDPRSQTLFRAPGTKAFKIIQKPPATMLALRRPVYSIDNQAQDLQGVMPPRWNPKGTDWSNIDDGKGFTHAGAGKEVDWLRYQHILRPLDWPEATDPSYQRRVNDIKSRTHRPQLITDFLSYNSYEVDGMPHSVYPNWVGDLMLEAEVKVEEPKGEFRMELSRGVDRFQARFNLQTGVCSLVRLRENADGKLEEKETLDSTTTAVNKRGTYQIRFANFDERLTVWVDRELPFGDGVSYERAWYWDPNKAVEEGARPGMWVNAGPTHNDLEPASVGSRGATVQVRHLRLWRNTYYTLGSDGASPDAELPAAAPPEKYRDPTVQGAWTAKFWAKFWGEPKASGSIPDDDISVPGWSKLQQLPFKTLYVQPGHYLCMGDNSPESYDGRSWGLVPERLMLGRALMVYWPLDRAGIIH